MSEGAADNKSAGAGSILSAARQRQGLSVADVARQLKLGVRQIEALEADDYKSLPRITFVRGFIRNYAKLLQIDAEPLLKPTEHLLPMPQVPEAEPGVAEIPSVSNKNNLWRSYAAFALFASLGVMFLVYEWYREQSVPRTKPVSAAVKPQKSKTPVAQFTPRPASPANPANTASPANQASTSGPVVPGDTPLPEQTGEARPVAQQIRSSEIRLEFDEETWVGITDKNGRTIFAQLNPAGSTQTVRGYPPFLLVAGNAAGVRLTYNDKPVDLQPYTKVDVARITLE
jgi:cytoskeleton protein RodZ